MNSRKRGIRLKPVNEQQEGYRALIDFFAIDAERSNMLAQPESPQSALPASDVTGPFPPLVGEPDQGARPGVAAGPTSSPAASAAARQRLARLMREELEQTLSLLEEALAACTGGETRPRRSD